MRALCLKISQVTTGPQNVLVKALPEMNLTEADRIFRVAFGTFLGLPNPVEFFGDADYVRTRWTADPSAAFGLT